MIKIFFAVISSLLQIIGMVSYGRSIFKKKTRPHLYSWLVWSILQGVGSVAIIFGQGGYGALGIGVGAIFCFSIFLLSIRFGTKNITQFDTFCLIGSILSIILWIFTKDPLLSVILISIIDFIAFLPTYRKGYEEPRSEDSFAYFISGVACAFSLFALSSYSLVTVLYLGSLVCSNTLFVIILWYRRRIIAEPSN